MAKEQRLIDANSRIEEIKKAYCTNCDDYNGIKCRSCWVDDAIGLIDDAPTVDAVEVVRCKDCEWFNKPGCAIYIVDDSDKPKENDFCSFGERRCDG